MSNFLYLHNQWHSNPQTTKPWCVCALPKSYLTAYWLNRALGLLHFRSKTYHEPRRSTPAAWLPWRRVTLMDSKLRCGHSAHICAMCFTLCRRLICSPSNAQYYRRRIVTGSRSRGSTEGNCSRTTPRAWPHAVLSIQGDEWEETTAFFNKYKTPSRVLSSLQNAIQNPKLLFNLQFINSKGEPI